VKVKEVALLEEIGTCQASEGHLLIPQRPSQGKRTSEVPFISRL
jgi:hypothetical protein